MNELTPIGVSLIIGLLAQAPPSAPAPPRAPGISVASPREWVSYSADVRIERPNRPEAWGRRLQDEHGCVRDEMVHPDGSAMITLLNFPAETTYHLLRGAWTSQPMKLGPVARQPLTRPVVRQVASIEGFDAYVAVSNVRSPRGDYTQEAVLIPALNFVQAAVTLPSGEKRTLVNLKLGPQAHESFVPPEGALITSQPGFSGFMSFSAVVLKLSFGGEAIEATTTEETSYALKTPSGIPLTLVTSVVDLEKRLVRVRVLTNASGSPGNVKGDLIDELQVTLGGTAHTTKLGETLTVSVTRIGMIRQ